MILDLIWVTAEVLSVVALLYGAYLALTATDVFQKLFGSVKAAVAARVAKERRLGERRAITARAARAATRTTSSPA